MIVVVVCLFAVSCRTTDSKISEFDAENAAVVDWPVLDQSKFSEYVCRPATKSWSNEIAQINAMLVKNPVIGSASADAIVDVWYYKVGGFQQTPVTDLTCLMKQETEVMFSYGCMADDAGEPKAVLVLDVSKAFVDGSLVLSAFDVGLEASDSPLGVARNRDSESRLRCVPHVFPRKVNN